MKKSSNNKALTLAALGLLVANNQQVAALSTTQKMDSSLNTLMLQDRKHHRKHHKKHGHRGSELIQNGKPSQDEESLAEQKTMDLVKEELENSLNGDKKEESGSDDETENQPKPIAEVIKEKEDDEKEKAEENATQQAFKEAKENAKKQQQLLAEHEIFMEAEAQKEAKMNAENDAREAKEEQEAEAREAAAKAREAKARQDDLIKEKEERAAMFQKEEQAQLAFERREKAEKIAAERAERAEAAEEKKGSASSLAHQLNHSIDESEQQPMINMVQSHQKYVEKAYGGGSVSSATTANLIADAIMHQKQKALGVEESAPTEVHPFSLGLKSATETIHDSLGVKESVPEPAPAPVSHLPELSNAIAVKPIVTKDELMESQNIKPLSLGEQSAKNSAVQKTLNLMRSMSGLAPKEEPAVTPVSNFISEPIKPVSIPQPVAASSGNNVQHMIEMLKAKKTTQPIRPKVILPKPKVIMPKPVVKMEAPKELTDSQKQEQEQAALEAMTSIEDRQNNAVKKSLIAQGKDLPEEKQAAERAPESDPIEEPKVNAVQAALEQTAKMEAVQKSLEEAKKREAEQAAQKAARDAQARLEVKQMQEKLAAQKADAVKDALSLIAQKQQAQPVQPIQPQIQVIVQPQAGSNVDATQNAVQKTLEAIKNAMNAGGAERISNAGQGASVTLNHVVAPAQLVPANALKDMLLKKKTNIAPIPVPTKAPEVKPVEKKDDGLSIETSKLDFDEKEMGIKSGLITKEQTPEKKVEEIKVQKLISKQSEKSDGSFQIETTSMEAEEQQQAQKQANPQSTSKTVTASPKKVEQKKEKKKEESHEFVIETTVATPQLMKSMIGDNSNLIPDFAEDKEEPKQEAPKFAPKTNGLQGPKPEVLAKAAPKVLEKKEPEEAKAKEITIESSSLAPLDPEPKVVIGDAITGAFDALPGFESISNNSTSSTIIAQQGITIEDTRQTGDKNDMKSLVKSIVSTIEPALSALGSQNHAAVSVVIRDTNDDKSTAQVSTTKSEEPQTQTGHNDKTPPFFMIKAQNNNSTSNPALQSSIVEAVSQATQNVGNKVGLDGKGFNMTLVVNPVQPAQPASISVATPVVATPVVATPTVATPSSGTVSLPAMPAGMEGMSQEYMAAVAVSLQKTKELEEAQHQAAIQKTLTQALEKKEQDRKLKEEQDQMMSLQMAKQAEEQKKTQEASQKAHDSLIQRSIELAKKKKVEDDAKAKVEAVKMAEVMKKMEEQKKVEEAQKKIDDAKKAQDEMAAMRRTSDLYKNAVQKSIAMANNKVTFTDMAETMNSSITPEKPAAVPLAQEASKQPEFEDNNKKAADLAAKLVSENPENALKVLEQQEKDDKQASLGAVFKTLPAQFNQVSSVSAKDNAVAKTIALMKAKQDHPLGGGLSDMLSVQTETSQQLNEEQIKKMKNATNITNSTSLAKTEPSTVKVAVNATIASPSNSTAPIEDNNSGNTTTSIQAIFNITKSSANNSKSLAVKTAVKSEAKATKVNATAPPANATSKANATAPASVAQKVKDSITKK